MKNTVSFLVSAWIAMLIGCATLRSAHYELEMTRRGEVIFIGFSCYKPTGWTGDQSSKEAMFSKVRRAIDVELKRGGFPHMTIHIEDPTSFELSASRLEFLAYAGDMPMNDLMAAARKMIAEDPLGKHRPKPFYHAEAEFSD